MVRSAPRGRLLLEDPPKEKKSWRRPIKSKKNLRVLKQEHVHTSYLTYHMYHKCVGAPEGAERRANGDRGEERHKCKK